MTQGSEVPGVISPRKVPSHLCDLVRSCGRLYPHLQAGVLGFLSPGVGQCGRLLVLAAQASRSYLRSPLPSKTCVEDWGGRLGVCLGAGMGDWS